MVGNMCSKKLKTILILSCLALMASVLACSGGEGSEQVVESRASGIAEKEAKKDKLPPVSSIKEAEGDNLQITAEELVKKLNKNNVKKNIKELFGKYADITGEVKRVDEKRGSLEVTLDGKYDAVLTYINCRIQPYTPEDMAAAVVGSTITVEGQIKALKEWSGDELGSNVRAGGGESKGQIVKPCKIK